MRNVSDILHPSKNNFTILRLVAAIFVIITHSYGLLGVKPEVQLLDSLSLSDVGLSVFFFISGLFITKSYENSSGKAFLWNRFLRIFPGLLIVVMLTVFVLGPLVTSLSYGDYFSKGKTYKYLLTALVEPVQFVLPGVFDNHPNQGVNGSLWTLPLELKLYGLIFALGVVGLLKKRFVLCITVLVLIFGYLFQEILSHLSIKPLLPYLGLGGYFMVGSMVCLYRDKIRISFKVLAVLTVIWVLFEFLSLNTVVNYLYLPYLILCVGSIKLPKIHADYSYGMYIYAFPIQQSLIYLLGLDMNVYVFMFLSIISTAPFAYFSWHFIEKRALSYKDLSIRKLQVL